MTNNHLGLLSLQAMARRLNVRPQDLRAAAEAGEIPASHVGDSLLFNADSVEQILLDRASKAVKGSCHE